MAVASISGMTALATTDNGLKIKLRALASTLGLTADSMKESGWITTCMASVFTHGRMAVCTKVNIRMTRSMDLESILGLTADATVAIGAEANSTA